MGEIIRERNSYLCTKAQKVHLFRPSLGFLAEAQPRLDNRRGQKALLTTLKTFLVMPVMFMIFTKMNL
jgi:hypothetical protein